MIPLSAAVARAEHLAERVEGQRAHTALAPPFRRGRAYEQIQRLRRARHGEQERHRFAAFRSGYERFGFEKQLYGPSSQPSRGR